MPKERKKKGVAPEGFPDGKWQKLPQNWRDAAEGKSEDELEQEIIKAAKAINTTSHDMEEDDKLNALKNELKDIRGAYTDAIAAERAKIDYAIYVLCNRGRG
jgi:hypothetical protein